jgi:hypothetical protein
MVSQAQHVEPEKKPEAKPETRPEIKPETKHAPKPDVKHDEKKPEAKPLPPIAPPNNTKRADVARDVVDVKVAAWQEAMNAYAAKHNGTTIAVDGAWGSKTEKLFESLGGDAQAVLNKMRKDGITLHPEHFEVAAPDSTPASARNRTQHRQ